MYNYKTQEIEGLLILVQQVEIFFILLLMVQILHMGRFYSIPGMTDFGFHAYNGRAYITPFTTLIDLLGTRISIWTAR